MSHDVFISYSSTDQNAALAVLHGLEAAGIRCWMAPRDIKPGMVWAQAIMDGIAGCRVMVVVFSANANKSLTDRAVETAVGQKKLGVPECDDLMDAIEAELNDPDDDIVTKALKATILNRIKDGIRESFEKNKTNKPELARRCTEYRAQFDKFKSDQAAEKK